MAYSMTRDGKLSEGVDIFGNPVWDHARTKAQQKAEWIRQQGFVGAAMLPMQELEYSAFRKSLAKLEERFSVAELAHG
jgi:fructose 1,6-bisphosphate aldolase/phosphatase